MRADKTLIIMMIIALAIIIFIAMNMNKNKKENYTSPYGSVNEYHYNDEDFFVTRGNYRAEIPPRFFDGDYRSTIHGAIPPLGVLATPINPMDHANMVGIDTNVPNCTKNMPPNQSVHDGKINDTLQYVDSSELLPGDMYNYNSDMGPANPNTYIYDRVIYANQKRRSREGADYIRGDLPIAPIKRGYHDVSVKPHLDLTKGALSYMYDINQCIEREDIMTTSARSDFNNKFSMSGN